MFRLAELDPGVHLQHLSLLKVLRLIDIELVDFRVPDAWGAHLTKLKLHGMNATKLPGNLMVLSSLVSFTLTVDETIFQIEETMQFLTQLEQLRRVHLRSANEWPWNAASRYALMQAHLLFDETPGCQVRLVER